MAGSPAEPGLARSWAASCFLLFLVLAAASPPAALACSTNWGDLDAPHCVELAPHYKLYYSISEKHGKLIVAIISGCGGLKFKLLAWWALALKLDIPDVL